MEIIILTLLVVIIILLIILFIRIGNQTMDVQLRNNREELHNAIERFQRQMKEELTIISQDLNHNARLNREETAHALNVFQEAFTQNVKTFNDLQREKFDTMTIRQDALINSTEKKLENIRETVDEKLHKTLEDRLGRSFKLVSERLEAVQKGLGEMQTLAHGVGDLKKVLTNVKARGVMGEIQLGNILEQIMAPEQYETNVKTRHDANDLVEYAIKLPGKDNENHMVYLPIDAKFPQEDYLRLQTAWDHGEVSNIDAATRALVQAVKKSARNISEKYLDPPHTTDFGIMFLPFEGLYAEVVRQPELVALLQQKYRIIITGPTTLAAILNSLQMGFKTLAIQKRSSEVWQVLGAVKTEFSKFGGVLERAQQKINDANKELDTLVGTRTRMMLSKLKKVEELPEKCLKDILPEEQAGE